MVVTLFELQILSFKLVEQNGMRKFNENMLSSIFIPAVHKERIC